MNMKRTILILTAGLSLGTATATEFQLGWSSTQSASGTARQSSQKFSVTGLAGQIVASGATTQKVVHGGFLAAWQKPEGPAIRLTIVNSAPVLVWTTQYSGFHVQAAPAVNGPWTDLGEGTLVNANRQIQVPAGYNFFRLRKDCPRS